MLIPLQDSDKNGIEIANSLPPALACRKYDQHVVFLQVKGVPWLWIKIGRSKLTLRIWDYGC